MIRPLRGRAAVRLIPDRPTGLIQYPGTHDDWERKDQQMQGIRAQSSHRAHVLGLGEPARNKWGDPVPWECAVGDEVLFVYDHHEKFSEDQKWEDGESCLYVSQEEVLAVLEP